MRQKAARREFRQDFAEPERILRWWRLIGMAGLGAILLSPVVGYLHWCVSYSIQYCRKFYEVYWLVMLGEVFTLTLAFIAAFLVAGLLVARVFHDECGKALIMVSGFLAGLTYGALVLALGRVVGRQLSELLILPLFRCGG